MTRTELTLLVDGLTPILHEFSAAVTARLAAIDGKAKGLDGAQGAPGPEGRAGRDGRDGMIGLAGLDGTPGPPGRDGTLDNLKIVPDGERTITFCFKDGTPIEGGVVQIPSVLDRGVWKDGTAYERGDGVTWRGSFWIAQEATASMPDASGLGSRAWRLAVKAGRDGKDGKPGPEGKQGAMGRAGRDLTQLMSDGTKY